MLFQDEQHLLDVVLSCQDEYLLHNVLFRKVHSRLFCKVPPLFSDKEKVRFFNLEPMGS